MGRSTTTAPVRASLKREGIQFRTESDTEVLLQRVSPLGCRCPGPASPGCSPFAIWDAHARQLFCARDRAGEKPFYYAVVDGAFLFASEIKGLLEWPGFPRRPRLRCPDRLPDVRLRRGSEKHLARRPKAAPGALDDGRAPQPAPRQKLSAPRRYWSLVFASRPDRPNADEIRQTLLNAANEMAIADVPLGSFLSGGVDSSTVTAALSLSGHTVRSFTIGFDLAAYDERPWARQVAQRYQTQHVDTDGRAIGRGFGVRSPDLGTTTSRSTTIHLFRRTTCAARHASSLRSPCRATAPMSCSPDIGSTNVWSGAPSSQHVFPIGVARIAAAVARHTLGEGSHWRRTLAQYGLAAPQMLADMMCNGFPLPLLRAVARGPLAEALRHYDPHRLVEQLLLAAPPDEVGLVNAMRHLDFALTLPGDMLVKLDRASMAVSLEVRPVFLHRDVMELAAGMPPADLVNRHAAKLALKDAVRPWLPDALIDRRKQGFAMPLPEWLGDDSVVGSTMRGAHASVPVGELLDLEQSRGARVGARQRRRQLHVDPSQHLRARSMVHQVAAELASLSPVLSRRGDRCVL